MKRREFIAMVGGAATWPLAARGQQAERMRRIGILHPNIDKQSEIELGAFREALQHLGWSDGRTVRIDYRDAQEDLQAAAIRLLGVHPDATVAVGVEALKALQKQTQSVPIV